jgi:2-polyprenyl-6-methoxyphenol hydroxylase-like FAD-dependent oxidoreductase
VADRTRSVPVRSNAPACTGCCTTRRHGAASGSEHGRRFTHATTSPGGRTVAGFADGGHAEGDLLLGADGVHSTTRTIIDPTAPEPRYLGTNTVCGHTRTSPATTVPGTYRMLYGRHAFSGHATAPDGETWWFATIPGAERGRAELAATTAEQWKRRTMALLAGDATPAADIVGSTGRDIVGSSAHDISSLPTWYSGPEIVLGDAAHAVSPSAGHGAAAAIEDGVVLAQCLRDLPTVEQAFHVWERLRRERVERLVATSAGVTGRAVPGPLGRLVRDALLSILLRAGPRNSSAWLTTHHIASDAPVAADPVP